MKKKMALIFCALFTVILSAFGLACCGGPEAGVSSGGSGASGSDSGKSDESSASVTVAFDETEMTLGLWEKTALSATASDGSEVSYTSSDMSVVYVWGGQAAGVKAGTASVTATAGEATATLEITVTGESAAKAPVLRISGKSEFGVGAENQKMTATLTHDKVYLSAEQYDEATFSFSSDNTEVAEIADDGLLVLKASGSAKITAEVVYCGVTFTEEKEIEVVDNFEMSVERTSIDIAFAKDADVTAAVVPVVTRNGEPFADAEFVFASSNESVLTVDAQGVVTARGQGEATVTVTAELGGQNYTQKVYISVTVPLTETGKTLAYEFDNADDVLAASISLAELGIGSELDAAEIIDIKTNRGEVIAEEKNGDIIFRDGWLSSAASGIYDCTLRSEYRNYTFSVALAYNFISSGLYNKVRIEEGTLTEEENPDFGKVYNLEAADRLTFNGEAIEALYVQGYVYMVMDVYFYGLVPSSIEMNLGGSAIGFYNNHKPYVGVYYDTADVAGEAYTPKNWIKTDDGAVPFLIYNAETGDVVCDTGCNNQKADSHVMKIISGATKDGSMIPDVWYTIVIPLENRTSTFAGAGISMSGLKNCYVKDFAIRTVNPCLKVSEGETGKLYEIKHSTAGAYNRVERVSWGRPLWSDVDTYYGTEIEKTADENGVYNTAAEGFFTESANVEQWEGAHFLAVDPVPTKTSSGSGVVRMNITFNSFQTIPGGHIEHSYRNFNFFAYVNDTWEYLTFNSSGASKLEHNGGLAVYDAATREIVLDGWSGPATGAAIQTGKEYIFEFNVRVGAYACYVMFCGCDDATISNIVWSGTRLTEVPVAAEDKSESQFPAVRNVYELEAYAPVEPTDGKIIVDSDARIEVSGEIRYEQIGDKASFTDAFNGGYTYAVFDLKFPKIDSTTHWLAAGNQHIYFNAKTGKIDTMSHQDVNVSRQMLKIYDAEKNLVTGGLAADAWYTFVFDMSKRYDQDFERCTLEFRSGFAGCEIANVMFVNEKFIAKYYPWTEYKVEHYLPDGEGGYTLSESVTLSAKIGENVVAVQKEYAGYALNEEANNVTSGVVLAGGALTLKLYYKQVKAQYTVEYYKERNGNYILVEEDSFTAWGDIGAEVTAEIKEYTDFEYVEEESVVSGVVTADNGLVLKVYYIDVCSDLSVTVDIGEEGGAFGLFLSDIRSDLTAENVAKVVLDGLELIVNTEGEIAVDRLNVTGRDEITGTLTLKDGKQYSLILSVNRLYVGKLYELTLAPTTGSGYAEADGMYWNASANVYDPYLPLLKTPDENGVYDVAAEGFLTQTLQSGSRGHWLQFDNRAEKTAQGYFYLRFTVNFTEFMTYASVNTIANANLVLQFGETWRYLWLDYGDGKAYAQRIVNDAQAEVGLNIYSAEGELLLDGMKKSNVNGTALQTGVNYIFEVDATIVGRAGAVMMSGFGFDKAKISDIVWAKECIYDYEAAAENKTAGHLYEMKYHYVAGDAYNQCERLVWGAGTYEGTLTAEKPNENGVYNTAAEGFFTEQANVYTWAGAHFLALDPTPAMLSAGYTRVRFKVTFGSFQTIASGHTLHSGISDFNLFAYINDTWAYVTCNDGGQSKLEQSGGLNVYDAETGALVLDGWSGTATGGAIVAGKEYVFEMNVQTGIYKCYVMLCGFDDAVISDIVWSDKAYA